MMHCFHLFHYFVLLIPLWSLLFYLICYLRVIFFFYTPNRKKIRHSLSKVYFGSCGWVMCRIRSLDCWFWSSDAWFCTIQEHFIWFSNESTTQCYSLLNELDWFFGHCFIGFEVCLWTYLGYHLLGTLLDGEPVIKLPPKYVKLKKVDFSREERDFYSKLEADSREQFQVWSVLKHFDWHW